MDAYALRASAYRFLDVLSLAKQDVETALLLAPDNAEALLEQGIIWRLWGKGGAARKVWSRLVQLHDGTPAAAAARKNLKSWAKKRSKVAKSRGLRNVVAGVPREYDPPTRV